MSSEKGRLTAYVVADAKGMELTSAPLDRDWMDATPSRFAYRCLPLTIANQAGWFIANPVDFTAIWDGSVGLDCVRLEFGSNGPAESSFVFGWNPTAPPQENRVLSHFGNGVLTFTIPYLFRTPPGINLWVKGPVNCLKDGIQALEGIVETDWLASTFTMNWRFTRPHHPVRFVKGEPICMVLPVPRGLAESLEPVQIPIEANPAIQAEYQTWEHSRRKFNLDLQNHDPETVRRGWQREYVKGVTPTGVPAPEHQTRLALKEFRSANE